ncbi:MAG: hypothetical protein U0S36_05250 [Candidatus Nanopelagicales bacterium]
MTAVLRRFSIRLRLIALAVIPLALVVLIALMAVSGFNGQIAATEDAQGSNAKAERALAMKYQAADWNGWQTAYAFDIALRGKAAAADSAESRAAFLASAAELDKQIGEFCRLPDLDEAEVAFIGDARANFDAFMKLDEQMIVEYRSTTRPTRPRPTRPCSPPRSRTTPRPTRRCRASPTTPPATPARTSPPPPTPRTARRA